MAASRLANRARIVHTDVMDLLFSAGYVTPPSLAG